jgi:PASTA domain
MSQQIITIPFNDQEIGQGFNRETGESIGTALSVANISEDPFTDGQKVFTSFQMVTDQDSLKESLGISAELDARYMLFSGDAKVSFTETHAINSCSTFVAGRCLVKNSQRHGHGFQLTKPASDVLNQDTASGSNRFKTAFGDMFVRDLNTGGEFLVIARVTSISEDHQRTLATSLTAAYNGLAAGGSFQADFTSAMQETKNHTEVAVWMTQSGGIGAQGSFTGPDATKILNRLSAFPESVHEHPVGYETVLATYDTIPLPVPPILVREAYELVLADCLQQKMGFLKALSDLDLAGSENGPLLFDGLPSNDDLTRMKGQYRTALSALLSHAIQVATGQMDPPQMFVANPAPPAFSFKKKLFVPTSLQVQMPDVTKKNPDEAHRILNAVSPQFHISDVPTPITSSFAEGFEVFNNGLNPMGLVVSQQPAAGTQVDQTATITLDVASGFDHTDIPPFIHH